MRGRERGRRHQVYPAGLIHRYSLSERREDRRTEEEREGGQRGRPLLSVRGYKKLFIFLFKFHFLISVALRVRRRVMLRRLLGITSLVIRT